MGKIYTELLNSIKSNKFEGKTIGKSYYKDNFATIDLQNADITNEQLCSLLDAIHADAKLCKSLKILVLSHNKLTELIIESLPNLRELDVSNNEIKVVSISDCMSLNYVNLKHNKIEYFSTKKTFSLKELDLSHNLLPVFLGKNFTELEVLKLHNNPLLHFFYPNVDKLKELSFPENLNSNLSAFNFLKYLTHWEKKILTLKMREKNRLKSMKQIKQNIIVHPSFRSEVSPTEPEVNSNEPVVNSNEPVVNSNEPEVRSGESEKHSDNASAFYDYALRKCGAIGCNNNTQMKCSSCNVVWYCDRGCQRSDFFEYHKQLCPIITRINYYKCSLSGVLMSSSAMELPCRHLFDKNSILEYLTLHNGEARCPLTGCDKNITYDDLRETHKPAIFVTELLAAITYIAKDENSPSDIEIINQFSQANILTESVYNSDNKYLFCASSTEDLGYKGLVSPYSKVSNIYKNEYSFYAIKMFYIGNLLKDIRYRELYFHSEMGFYSMYFADFFCIRNNIVNDDKFTPQNMVLKLNGKTLDLNKSLEESGYPDTVTILCYFKHEDPKIIFPLKFYFENVIKNGNSNLATLLIEKKLESKFNYIKKVICDAKQKSTLYNILLDRGRKQIRPSRMSASYMAPGLCARPGCSREAEDKFKCPKCNIICYCSLEAMHHHFIDHGRMCSIIKFAQSLKCPLTKTFMINPVKSKICGHVYENEAIEKYINLAQSKGIILEQVFNLKSITTCPKKDCGKEVRLGSLQYDFYTARMTYLFLNLIELNPNYKGAHNQYQYSRIFNRKSHVAPYLQKPQPLKIFIRYVGVNKYIEKKHSFMSFECTLENTIKDVILQFYNKCMLSKEKIKNGYLKNIFQGLKLKQNYYKFPVDNINKILSKMNNLLLPDNNLLYSLDDIAKFYFICRIEGSYIDIEKTIVEAGLLSGTVIDVNFIQEELNPIVALYEVFKDVCQKEKKEDFVDDKSYYFRPFMKKYKNWRSKKIKRGERLNFALNKCGIDYEMISCSLK